MFQKKQREDAYKGLMPGAAVGSMAGLLPEKVLTKIHPGQLSRRKVALVGAGLGALVGGGLGSTRGTVRGHFGDEATEINRKWRDMPR